MSKAARSDAADVPACPQAAHVEHRLRRKGRRTSAAGTFQRYECVGPNGETHNFWLPTQAGTHPKPRKVPCPEHADGRTRSRGTRSNKAGTWRRYRCERSDGQTHDFQVLENAAGSALASLTRPPECAEHPGASVTRHGAYGAHRKRQRYRCVPVEGTPHTFTPPLSREQVQVGADSCATCDELLSPHRGTQIGARGTSWSLPAIVRALNELSMGASYASTALLMREQRELARKHLHEDHGFGLGGLGGVREAGMTEPGGTYAATEGKNAWHLAADLVEQYAPLVWQRVEGNLQRRERAARGANDQILVENPEAHLLTPLTWVLDEQRIFVKRRGPSGRRELLIWVIHVVVEVRWRTSTDKTKLPEKDYRLRLARAYPRGTADTWRLVFQELGVRPDVVVADCGESITGGLNATYGPGAVGFIPSLYHLRKNLTAKLLDLPHTSVKVEGRKRLLEVFAKPLDALGRDDLLNMSEADIRTWWDTYLQLLADHNVPTGGVLTQRRVYEDRTVAAVPLLRSHPQLPASNAAVENRIRTKLDPFLTNRKQMYRNLARTNFLLDLAVARDQGAFGDLDRLMVQIRDDNIAAGGWARRPRSLDDPQPPSSPEETPQRYSSLMNAALVDALLEHRGTGLPTTGGGP